jgi:hypothetical protein
MVLVVAVHLEIQSVCIYHLPPMEAVVGTVVVVVLLAVVILETIFKPTVILAVMEQLE